MSVTGNRLEILLTCEASGQLWNTCVWDPNTGTTLKSFKGHVSRPRTLCFVGNSFMISGQPSKPLLNVWHVNRHEQKPLKYTTPGVMTSIAVSPCGHFLIGCIETRIYVWQTASGKLLKVLDNVHYQRISQLKFTSDGSHFISAGDDGNVMAWPLYDVVNKVTCKASHTWSGHSLAITDFFVGCGGLKSRVFTASKDQTGKVYDLYSGRFLLNIEFPRPLTAVVADMAEETAFYGSADGPIYQVGLKSPPRDLNMNADCDGITFDGHTAAVTCLSVSLDGLVLASGSDDNSARLWHIKSRQCVRVLGHKGPLTNLVFTTPVRGMLEPDLYVQSDSLALLDKIASSGKKLIDSDTYSVDVFLPPFDEEKTRASVDEICRMANDNDLPNVADIGTENDAENGEDDDEISRLKMINMQLYRAAVKEIMK